MRRYRNTVDALAEVTDWVWIGPVERSRSMIAC